MLGNTWAKSSYSTNGHCLTARWHISSRSGGNGCVEARQDGSVVQVKDSKDPQSPILEFAPETWAALIDAIRTGRISR